MAKRNRYYVVFEGRNPGVYDDWEDARMQVENYKDAVYRAYDSSDEAALAFRKSIGMEDRKDLVRLFATISEKSGNNKPPEEMDAEKIRINPEIDPSAWAVDASCLGNPGKMEYRGVEVASGKEIFRIGPFEDSTNNIGEFLAIVHAMALMFQRGERHTIYSDSVTGMAWVRTKKIKTKLTPSERNRKSFEMMARALTWLNTHATDYKVLKWQTERWGEIPADFGRK